MPTSVTDFKEKMLNAYQYDLPGIMLGAAMHDNHTLSDVPVKVAMKTLNRHGLIAGATGTGKTVTVQVLSEALSEQGVPVLLMDLKGDLSGLGAKGNFSDKLLERQQLLGINTTPTAMPVTFLSLSQEPGARLRTTLQALGPVMLARMLGLNDTQTSVTSMVFKYAKDQALPLLDLRDFKKVLHYLQSQQDPKLTEHYGSFAKASLNTILRKCVGLEGQGGEALFGEPSFDVNDLLHTVDNRGQISVLRLTDIQNKPQLFSTFMLFLLSEVYLKFPEVGDLEKPKFVMFIDEAHLIFKHASQQLIDYIEGIVRLIRSKGVGIYFCTQNPTDIPEAILGQLGLKIQHALRAFTARDRKQIKLTAQNYPISDDYDVETCLTNLGIGEAFITALDPKGRPSPLVACMLKPPCSRLGPLLPDALQQLCANSALVTKYQQVIDRKSAHEILDIRQKQTTELEQALPHEGQEVLKKRQSQYSFLEKMSKSTLVRQIGRTIFRELTRAALSALGIRRSRRR